MMLPRPEIILLILGCTFVTLLPRVMPLLLLEKLSPGPRVLLWLRYVVPAVIVSLLCQEVLVGAEGMMTPLPVNKMLAAALTMVVALVSRSIILTVVCGVVLYSLLGFLLE